MSDQTQALIREFNQGVITRIENAYRQEFHIRQKIAALPDEEHTPEWEWFMYKLDKELDSWECKLPPEAITRIRREVSEEMEENNS